MAAPSGAKPRLLLDTNVVIAHENDGPTEQSHADAAAELVRLANGMGFPLLLSNGTRQDFLNAPTDMRERRLKTLDKYYRTLGPVNESPNVRDQFPQQLGQNDAADVEVLSTFDTGVATVLVTEDATMKRRAERAGLTRILTIQNAVDWLEELGAPDLFNAIAAKVVEAYRISRHASIFDSLRDDYDGFDNWWTEKVVRQDRHAIILGDAADPDGIAVLKAESQPFDLGDSVLKVCTFKVVEQDGSAGAGRRGEFLLRAVVDYARETNHPVLYMTVHPHHEKLLAWLEKFGFTHHDDQDNGELVMVKRLEPRAGAEPIHPLEHAVTFGPVSLRVLDAHLVPIRYHLHDRLLPDSSPQTSLFPNEPCGNAIRKAYLCRSPSRKLKPGDTLAFLRTKPTEAARITAIGVVEQTFVSVDPAEVAARVRGRTVYSYVEIAQMCAQGEVLVVLFRLDRRVDPPWSAGTLNHAGVMSRSPQSIAQIKPEGVRWLRTELDASP
ncbi:GNAT family N-acetyltransferase [Aeromicrobium chenweiae]|uniref:Uncharacterized protein n=1 Tax=Aeromicrobium chenweiae TaxID=2079793 RepID=A0A2S0WIM2_9ACTN|nr:GNAT family N-acetyltransferase [Aeromicrobium chenweiae]AWB91157.1 hypothetical protein C3E78_02370 [Aeromicrobium chenweiae]TGN31676.1 GNAT family N-acetyltransferase [Aeromicrobium chenweiae]